MSPYAAEFAALLGGPRWKTPAVRLSVRVFWVVMAALGMQLMEFEPTLKHALGLWIYGLSTAAALQLSAITREIRTAFLRNRLRSPRP